MFVTSLTASLVDKKGKILIPGIYDSVAPLTEDEKKLYEKIEFDLDEYCKDVGVEQLLHDTKAWNSFSFTITNSEAALLGVIWR